jgi:hypothetical protein
LPLGQPPFGVRTPAPCARAGAWRVDQHQVHLAFQRRQLAGPRHHLDVAIVGTADAVEDRRQPRLLGIIGKYLAAVFHCRRQRQRLAAGTGAIVEHLHAGGGAGKLGDDLRAFVLHLEPALLVAGLGLDIGMAAGAVDRRDADAVRRKLRLGGADARELGQHAVAARLQCVDAQVERRPARQRRAFMRPVLAERRFEQRHAPGWTVGANFGWRILQLAQGQRLQLV